MKKLFLILPILCLFTANLALADVVGPDWTSKECKADEETVICDYSQTDFGGPITKDECKPYENNPSYYELTSHGSTFGGQVKYCKVSDPSQNPDAKQIEQDKQSENAQNLALFSFVIGCILAGFVGLSLIRGGKK